MKDKVIKSIEELVREKFPESSTLSHLLKLRKETNETISSPEDLEEWADMFIALNGAFSTTKWIRKELEDAIVRKVEKCHSLEFVKVEDGTYQSLKYFEVWMEGFKTSDGTGKAELLVEGMYTSFDEAVSDVFNKKGYEVDKHTINGESLKYTVWGCGLFDNEQDARKNFG